ncbi:MAG TPA: GNAT family N-acetyltransferase [Actinomycetota bacterium]|nr:GNAT family N-acetyltransferase [Actinomycetota bacterium]
MEIREATAAEHDAAGQITAGAYREFFDASGRDPDGHYLQKIADVAERARRTTILVAVEGGTLIGSLTLELATRVDPDADPLEAHRAHIRMLGVEPAARGRGVGRALMAAAEERAGAAGKTEMTLNTTRLMTAAQAMYASMGYERLPDETLPDGFVLLTYRKELGAGSL